MTLGFHTVQNLSLSDASIIRGRYGVIDVESGRFQAVRFRPFPKLISIWEVGGIGSWRHRLCAGDRCHLYFNQPRSCPGYLSLAYVESTAQSTLKTIMCALSVLDAIARSKHCEAIVCELSNRRIADRVLVRFGWERHCLHLRGRHFIKRLT